MYFSGTGDLCTALLLAWSQRLPNDFQRVCEITMSIMQRVLDSTVERGSNEILLIENKDSYEHPTVTVTATCHPIPT